MLFAYYSVVCVFCDLLVIVLIKRKVVRQTPRIANTLISSTACVIRCIGACLLFCILLFISDTIRACLFLVVHKL